MQFYGHSLWVSQLSPLSQVVQWLPSAGMSSTPKERIFRCLGQLLVLTTPRSTSTVSHPAGPSTGDNAIRVIPVGVKLAS
ncbi:hypothetical protein BgiBS90_007597 [Biomphalaria glabrata]|nr:hypothetical protein BgiBS90_007597 [Biomphalaria glabrata]